MLLFTPSELNDRFYIGEEKLPSKAIEWIVKEKFNHIKRFNLELKELGDLLPESPIYLEEELDVSHPILLQIANSYRFKDTEGNDKQGWNTGWKEQTRIDSIIKQGADYFISLKASAGRKVISPEMNMDAITLKEILCTNIETKDYFIENEENTLLFQLEIFTKYVLDNGSEISLKGALDIVRFDHKNRTAQIADFKSSYSAFSFIDSIKKFGYCDQLSFYDYLLREWLIEYCEGKYCDYTIIPPINIVIDIGDKIPYIYEYSWRDIALAADGNKELLYSLFQTSDHNMKIKKGWKRVLDEIGWHYTNNLWEKPKEMYEKKRISVNLLNS